ATPRICGKRGRRGPPSRRGRAGPACRRVVHPREGLVPVKMKIEKAPDRLTARSETMSLASGLILIAFLASWIVVAGMELPRACADRSWERASRPLGGIAIGTLLFGGSALF